MITSGKEGSQAQKPSVENETSAHTEEQDRIAKTKRIKMREGEEVDRACKRQTPENILRI